MSHRNVKREGDGRAQLCAVQRQPGPHKADRTWPSDLASFGGKLLEKNDILPELSGSRHGWWPAAGSEFPAVSGRPPRFEIAFAPDRPDGGLPLNLAEGLRQQTPFLRKLAELQRRGYMGRRNPGIAADGPRSPPPLQLVNPVRAGHAQPESGILRFSIGQPSGAFKQRPSMPDSDLCHLPGAAPGLLWMLQQCGIHSMQDLARAEVDDLTESLGPVGRVLRVEVWLDFARRNQMMAAAE